jgi:ribonucleoside-diphosphate reductase alpha chain
MWINQEFYNGLSVLNYDNGSYVQAPFQDITKDEYEKRINSLTTIDLTKVMEVDDLVDFGQVSACSGSQCEINL